MVEAMHIPVGLAWTLVVLFAVLVVPSVSRLVRAEPGRLAWAARETDLTELLMALAMVAMVSPLGGPIPAAGWAAVLALAAGWFLVAAFRRRRCCAVHHAVVAAAMLYMIIAMPGQHADHGPWLTMSGMGTARLAFPALAVVAGAYFGYDAVRVGTRAARNARTAGVKDATVVRPVCRSVMGAAMAYLFVAAAW
jgi:hypothetical protein